MLRVQLVTPAEGEHPLGNRVTAERWAAILGALGHEIKVGSRFEPRQPIDLLVAIHAARSAAAVAEARAIHPRLPIVVLLSGTDVYGDLAHDPAALRSLALCDRAVVLQPRAIERLPPAVQPKARTILQSALPPAEPLRTDPERFVACVLAHLRPVKDPFRAAEAARLAPQSSRLLVLHAGAALSEEMRARAKAESSRNPRWRWLGARPREEALRIMAGSELLVLSSLSEGGANVISEAAVAGVAIIASRVEGSVGLLGEAHPGYFPPGDTAALARLLRRAEEEATFLAELRAASRRLGPCFAPSVERQAWTRLLEELGCNR